MSSGSLSHRLYRAALSQRSRQRSLRAAGADTPLQVRRRALLVVLATAAADDPSLSEWTTRQVADVELFLNSFCEDDV